MILSEEKRTQFVRLHNGLLAFFGREGMVPTPPDIFSLRKGLWEDPEWISRYVSENPDKLPAEELEIVSGWRDRMLGSFCVFKQLKKHAVFIEMDSDDAKAFGVQGLTTSLNQWHKIENWSINY
jgi:hypothetical protein